MIQQIFHHLLCLQKFPGWTTEKARNRNKHQVIYSSKYELADTFQYMYIKLQKQKIVPKYSYRKIWKTYLRNFVQNFSMVLR